MPSAISIANPFPVEPVATYGRLPLATYEGLSYFSLVHEELLVYLSSYVEPNIRYGGAIGLSGSHGSGKTHLLNWIAGQALNSRQISPVVVYAKADSDSFFDLYTALAACISIERFKELIGEALRQIAIRYLNRARATESMTVRLVTPESLPQLYAEENLSEADLRQMLEKELALTELPEEIRRAVMLLDSSQAGEKTYQWLLGKRVEGLGQLGLPYQLSDLAASRSTTTAPETMAVDGLEVIAALCRIAEKPLIVLIDQMEILFDAPQVRLPTLYSLIKKLFEQLGSQNALLFLAGTGDTWGALRRDVAPRLRTRDPIEIGRLNSIETEALLSAYTPANLTFPPEAIGSISRLSGGNPREILSIAYQAFRESSGAISSLDENAVVRSARRAGSLRDREKLALLMADTLLNRQENVRVFQSLVLDGSDQRLRIDRLVELSEKPVLAIKMMAAADRVAEATLGREIVQLCAAAVARWPAATIIVVSVGYTSEQVARLIGSPESVTVVEFDEADFVGKLQTIIVDALRRSDSFPQESEKQVAIESKLKDIEVDRQNKEKQVQQIAVANLAATALPAAQERERKTRREIMEGLDTVLRRIPISDLEYERSSIRSLLITNEAYVQNGVFEQLGDAYLDVLNTAQMVDSESPSYLRTECIELRQEIAQRMLETLRGRSLSDKIRGFPIWVVILSASIFLLAFSLFFSLLPVKDQFTDEARRYGLLATFGVVAIFLCGYTLLLMTGVWRWQRRARILRSDAMRAVRRRPEK